VDRHAAAFVSSLKGERIMFQPLSRLLGFLALGLLLGALGRGPAFSQEKGPAKQPPKDLKTVKLEDKLFKELTNKAVTYKAFAIEDLKTGKPIAAETMITLSNKKTMKASTYYANLNDLEKRINALGHSLRDKKPILIQEIPTPTATLKQQEKDLAAQASKLDPGKGFKMKTVQDVQAAYKDGQKTDAARIKSIEAHWPQKGKDNKKVTEPLQEVSLLERQLKIVGELQQTVTLTVGDPSSFYSKFDVNAAVVGYDSGDVMVLGSVQELVDLFGNQTIVGVVEGDLNAPKSGNTVGSVDVRSFGQTVLNVKENTSTSWFKTDSFKKSFDQPIVNVTVSLLGVPITATLGCKGEFDASYAVLMWSASATGDVEANAQVSVYGLFAVGPDWLDVGVAGEVVLVSGSGKLFGDVMLNADNKGVYYAGNISGSLNANALSGRLYVFAKADLPIIGTVEVDADLWNWTGLTANLNFSKSLPKTYFTPK
jgi:hypothetical protein